MLHRNSFKRLYNQDSVYFITTNTYQKIRYFQEEIFCQLFIDTLRICKLLKGFKLYAFVLIPWHIHLMLKPGERFNISQIMFSIKKQFAHDANIVMGLNEWYPWSGGQRYFRSGGQTIDRLPIGRLPEDDLPGSGFPEDKKEPSVGEQSFGKPSVGEQSFVRPVIDRRKKLLQYRSQFSKRYGHPQYRLPQFKWQQSFYDRRVRNEHEFYAFERYIARNPVKHGLVRDERDYRWSFLNPRFEGLID